MNSAGVVRNKPAAPSATSTRSTVSPKNTPKAIIDIFAGAVKQVMNTEEFKANALKTAFPSDYQGPEEYAAYIKKLDTVYKALWDKYGKSPDAVAK